MPWFKGNLHTHTNLSDGDSPPGEVARWYDDHGYDFLIISDHNVRFPPEVLQAELRAEGRHLLLIPGEELTTWWSGPERTYALHVNGYGTSVTHGEADGGSVSAILQRMVDRVVTDGGLASVNHPNFWESITWQEIAALEELTFLELYNGHHLAANEGTPSQPPMEQVWDLVLRQGRRVWGLAVDDAHDFQSFGADRANPGRGWVEVAADAQDAESVLAALGRGLFYASTGPSLLGLSIEGGALLVVADRPSQVEFIGDGQLVEVVSGEEARFPRGRWAYLRARVVNELGVAWSQPQKE
ncbi:MAG: CehA/McbA family metallohydrolase [Acidimicrobiia bacterium]